MGARYLLLFTHRNTQTFLRSSLDDTEQHTLTASGEAGQSSVQRFAPVLRVGSLVSCSGLDRAYNHHRCFPVERQYSHDVMGVMVKSREHYMFVWEFYTFRLLTALPLVRLL